MEKAYAKLHGSFQMLNGGSMGESMVDLSGGVSEKYNLTVPDVKSNLESGQFWKDLKKWHQLGYLIGCAKIVKDENGKQEEGSGTHGIMYNHAYGILRVVDIDQLQLIRVRNPWGTGQGEWTGKFADEDEAWDDHRGLKEKLGYTFQNDGNWWMSFDDWKKHYSKVYVFKIFPMIDGLS